MQLHGVVRYPGVSLLSVENESRRFGGILALEDVSFQVSAGRSSA